VAAVVEDELDANLEPEVDETLDHRLLRRAVRLEADLEIVRADPGVAEAVYGPDKAHHELVRGMLVEVPRLAGLLDPALVHDDDAIGDLHGLFLVVRHENGRDVDLFVEPAEPRAELLPDTGVEGAERLVEEEDPRLDRERARERHALALAAGELRRVAVREAVELHESQELVDARSYLALRATPNLEPEGDVLRHREVLEGGVVLKDHPDTPLLRR
jgi:hypothetical protein